MLSPLQAAAQQRGSEPGRSLPSGQGRQAARLVALLHHRWSVPILAELHRTRGSKFATLLQRLAVSRESLSRTLAALTGARWVMRNPGYGHPLRPEYILTRKGRRLAPLCAEVLGALRRLSRSPDDLRALEEVALRKWSLPVLFLLGEERRRFSTLKTLLPGVTARALTMALKELQAADLVEREITRAYPPGTVYGLTQRGRVLRREVFRMGARA